MDKYQSAIPLALLLSFVSACQDDASKADLLRFRVEAKSAAHNRELLRGFFAAIDRNEFAKLQELASADYVLSAPGLSTPVGLPTLFELVTRQYTSFPDWRHTIADIMAEGGKVAVKAMQKGTHKAEYDGVAASDKEVTTPGAYLFRVANGKVQEPSPPIPGVRRTNRGAYEPVVRRE